MRTFYFATILCGLLMSACQQDDALQPTVDSRPGVTFQLTAEGYEGVTRTAPEENSVYDRVEYYFVDSEGNVVSNLKSSYNPSTSQIYAEGLHEGSYQLLVLGVKGDADKDQAEISRLNHAADTWLSFPADLQKPLEAEYFHSQTPFTVTIEETGGVRKEVASLSGPVTQKRLMGRIDLEFAYQNPYVRTAVESRQMSLRNTVFYTTLSGNGQFGGASNGQMPVLPLEDLTTYRFMPTVEGKAFEGEVVMQSRTYQGKSIEQHYSFSQEVIQPNRINTVHVQVVHPEDKSGVMFVTARAYHEGNHAKILQDGEPKTIYANEAQRKFNTAQPLQVSATEDGQLHVRFYSPRGLSDVMVKARIPAIGNEYVDFAYFDTIPPFADFYEEIPVTRQTVMFRTASGKQLETAPLAAADIRQAAWQVESGCDYWHKLQEIKYGWDISFHLYDGNPDLEDGGPVGNWMGIRPVHCRESVAFFLNYTYLLGLPEVETLIYDNASRLHDNNGVLVPPERILEQMRTKRNLRTGLIYEGNGVAGLGGGSTWGVAEWIYLDHYNSAYACSLAIHEIGHVMGYGHSSSFTYGPWATELMNHFYVNNLYRSPVNSADYLNSKNNPNLYYK